MGKTLSKLKVESRGLQIYFWFYIQKPPADNNALYFTARQDSFLVDISDLYNYL